MEYSFFPENVAATLPPLYSQDEKGINAIAYVKFFTPDSNWTWYATEYNPDTGEMFGLVQGFYDEMGYFNVNELRELIGPMGLKVERDMYFDPTPLKDLSAFV